MKITREQIFIYSLSIITIIVGLYFSATTRCNLMVVNVITLSYLKWPLLVIGGALLLILRAWARIMYIIAGIIYITYDIILSGALILMAIFMNDSNVPNKELIRIFSIYFAGIIPFIFYWVVTIFYLNTARVKELFKK